MDDLAAAITETAEKKGFSGVVRVDDAGQTLELAFGLADRAHERPNRPRTQFAMASGSKTFTALAVMSLVNEGTLDLDESVRRWLGDDLKQIDDAVTLRHLLSHTSGVGEYLDDDADADTYILPGSMHTYLTPEDFVPLLDVPMLGTPGKEFFYNNGGFVLLGLIAQRASGIDYQDLVRQRVFQPAGLTHTDFLRSDELPGTAAIGYLYEDGARTNIFHLPIQGSADGGAYTTVADLVQFWTALAAGRIVPSELVEMMTTPAANHDPDDPYGLGVWLLQPNTWTMIGEDAGASLSSNHEPGRGFTWSVLSNHNEGAWKMTGLLLHWARTGDTNPPPREDD